MKIDQLSCLVLASIAGIALVRNEVKNASVLPIPVGSVISYAGEKLPDQGSEWMSCEGQSLKISDNLELFKVIGWTYGPGADPSGRTTFQLPDYRGLFFRGLDNKTEAVDLDRAKRKEHFSSVTAGPEIGSIQLDSLQSHKHLDSGHTHPTNASASTWIKSDNTDDRDVGSPPAGATVHTGHAQLGDPVDSSGGEVRHGFETRPKNVYVYYLIKVK